MPYVNVHVDASDILEELDTDDLVQELERRGQEAIGLTKEGARDLAHRLWEAFYTKKPDARVLEIARELAEQATGRLVPRPPQLRRVA